MTHIRTIVRATALLAVIPMLIGACSIEDLVDVDPPTGTGTPADPDALNNELGTREMYRGVLNKFREATSGAMSSHGYIVYSGMLGDELNAGRFNTATSAAFTPQTIVDSRWATTGDGFEGGYEGVWRQLHGVRVQSMNTIGALRKYGPNQPKDFTGHAFALWGMAEVMLANFFCSGIPLTTIEFEGSFQYAAGSTTVEVYEHALTLFDSALANAPDSADVRNLAKVGKGWALLNLQRYAEAAQVVADVPTSFVYKNYHSTAIANSTGTPNFTSSLSATTPHAIGNMGTVSDREGVNGLPYRSSNDPRTVSPLVLAAQAASGNAAVYKPNRWRVNGGDTPIIMASGVEARLIEAEAALAAGNAAWLQTLNSLRTSGSFTTAPNPTDPTRVDTTWAPGSGAILFTSIGGTLPGLRPLANPATPAARLDLLMQERAYWLFLTGRRHADMRRLVRQYGRSEETVFPVGPYPAGPVGSYGTEVNAPSPADEQVYNTRYKGCFDRQA